MMNDLLTSVLQTESGMPEIKPAILLIVMGVAFVLGLIVSIVYLKTSKKIPSQTFAITLVLLPAVVTIIIMLVDNNVARAFSLAGTFTIVRFRSAPGDPKDITLVLFDMAIGLACGMGYIVYAAIVAVMLCVVMLLLELSGFGSSKITARILQIAIPEDLDYRDVFNDILEKYTKKYSLIRIKTANLGSIYELSYKITMLEDTHEKEFIDEIRCRNGNLNVSLVMEAGGSDYPWIPKM